MIEKLEGEGASGREQKKKNENEEKYFFRQFSGRKLIFSIENRSSRHRLAKRLKLSQSAAGEYRQAINIIQNSYHSISILFDHFSLPLLSHL